MRITCTTIDEFLECLDAEEKIFQGVIRVCAGRRPLDPSAREQTRFDVIIQASALVEVADAEYLLQVGLSCGKDYEDASQSREGSENVAAIRQRITEYAAGRQWRVLPGVIEE